MRRGAERHVGGPLDQQRGEGGRGEVSWDPAKLLIYKEVHGAIGCAVEPSAHAHLATPRDQRPLAPSFHHIATRPLRVQLALQVVQRDRGKARGVPTRIPETCLLPIHPVPSRCSSHQDGCLTGGQFVPVTVQDLLSDPWQQRLAPLPCAASPSSRHQCLLEVVCSSTPIVPGAGGGVPPHPPRHAETD